MNIKKRNNAAWNNAQPEAADEVRENSKYCYNIKLRLNKQTDIIYVYSTRSLLYMCIPK